MSNEVEVMDASVRFKKQIYPNATTSSHLETEKKKHSWPSATGKIKSDGNVAFIKK